MSDISQKIAALSPEKLKLLAQRLSKKQGDNFSRSQIVVQSRETNSFPLSFAQQRLWFLDQLQPGHSAYNISQSMHLVGQLNVAALDQSFNELIRRHEILRTTFTAVDGEPIQIIAPTLSFKLQLVDLQELPEDKRKGEVLRLAYEEAQQPFDLAKSPLLRVTLLRQTETEQALLLTMHHIISDGWSIGVLIHEITILYKAFSNGKPSLRYSTLTQLPELSIQYADFAVWQRQWLQGKQLETQLAYWKQQLGSRLPIVELPTDRKRPTIQTFSGARESLILPKSLSEKLKVLNQRQGITLFMILLAAFQTLLFWYTGQEDIVVGTDIANRNQAETKGLIGFFANQLVLRTDLSGNPTFLELLERVREMTLDAYAHQDLPFDKLVDALNPKRELNRSPLFQVKLVLENTQTPSLELPSLTISALKAENKTVQFDLLLELNETEKGLFGIWEYNTDLFHTVSIVQMSKNFEVLLGKIASNPEVNLSELKTILSEAEKQQNLAREEAYQSNIQQKLMNVKRKCLLGRGRELGVRID